MVSHRDGARSRGGRRRMSRAGASAAVEARSGGGEPADMPGGTAGALVYEETADNCRGIAGRRSRGGQATSGIQSGRAGTLWVPKNPISRCQACLRRIAARPNRPIPRSVIEAGSGTEVAEAVSVPSGILVGSSVNVRSRM